MLHDLLRANERRVTIEEIQKKVAEHFNIKMAEMTSARRARVVARPRQVAMYLAKQLTPRSLPEIGRKFGGRDHTTVMHAVPQDRGIDARDDRALAEDVELLRGCCRAERQSDERPRGSPVASALPCYNASRPLAANALPQAAGGDRDHVRPAKQLCSSHEAHHRTGRPP